MSSPDHIEQHIRDILLELIQSLNVNEFEEVTERSEITDVKLADEAVQSGSYERILAGNTKTEDKETGPGIISSKDGKTVYNLDEKCPPIPYCEHFEATVIPLTNILLYPTRVTVNLYDESNERYPQVIMGANLNIQPISFLYLLGFLGLQLGLTMFVSSAIVFVEFLNNFVLSYPMIMYPVLIVDFCIYFMIICVQQFRREKPNNYAAVITYCILTGYILGLQHAMYRTNKLFLISLCETIIILVLILLISHFFCCDFTACFFLIESLMSSTFIFYIIAIIYNWATGSSFLIFIFCYMLVPCLCLFLIQQFQLMVGKGKYAMQTDEDIMTALHMYIEIITIFGILPVFVTGEYVY